MKKSNSVSGVKKESNQSNKFTNLTNDDYSDEEIYINDDVSIKKDIEDKNNEVKKVYEIPKKIDANRHKIIRRARNIWGPPARANS